MTITHSQVADLRPGDVVELTSTRWGGASMRGPLVCGFGGELRVGNIGCTNGSSGRGYVVRLGDGSPSPWADKHSLTVVSRAPRQLYVNHPRTEPVPGDVVRAEFYGAVFMRTKSQGWIDRYGDEEDLKRRDGLRLLVDGETGQVVP